MVNYLTEAIFLQGGFFVKGTSGGANGQIEYLCIPKRPKILLTDPEWIVLRYIYDADGFQTKTLVANGEPGYHHRADSPSSLDWSNNYE
jgi:hypothetical protein